ncbi:RNA12 protein-domain-containing protein [Podospora fimiseda]|uniref:Mitochondrial escape protein 2 n=1 Tax=Podospora fimiseda TaxID=252190 RepID=A0AAN7BKN6_9PEZI|nr:RNA12 protein-domain-containing protein [Podospora fimiseda]
MIPGRHSLQSLARPGLGLAATRTGRYRLPVILGHTRNARRWETTAQVDGKVDDKIEGEKTGHIEANPMECIIFFDNLFPLKLSSYFFWRPWKSQTDFPKVLKRLNSTSLGMFDPAALIKRAIPKDLPMDIIEIIPRTKEGGAYVKFRYPRYTSAADIQGKLSEYLEKSPVKPWFSPFRGISTGLVLGRPWLEDLYRLPKSRLRVEFVAAKDSETPDELSQESIYNLFRRYGWIADITSQPPDSKVLPKYAYVDFVLAKDAVMARNCLHGFVLQEEGSKVATRLRLSYEQKVKPHNIWNWITNHPRIVIPVLVAFIAAFSVIVFDPIREFFVKAHVQKSLEFTDSRLYKWLKRQTTDILSFGRRKEEGKGLHALFSHRKDLIDSIKKTLLESEDTFVVIHGPPGSGGRDLVLDQVLGGRKKVLVLDCKPVIDARGEAGTIGKLAMAVGYRPVFSWTNSISSMLDLAIQGTTGVKAGLSENLESQVTKILQTSAAALKKVSLTGRKKSDNDAHLSDDAYLEAHPEDRAVVVIDNFMHKTEDKGFIYDKISEWAATLVENNIAHVIFLTTDTSFSKPLSRALPDRVINQVTLGDLSSDVAKHFVVSQLDNCNSDNDEKDNHNEGQSPLPIKTDKQKRNDLEELDECIETLGGRLTDLQVLARRLKVGQSPKRAVSDIVDQSAADILRMFLLAANKSSDGGEKKWSNEQAWYLVKSLASQESLKYNEVLLHNTFASSLTPGASSPEAALESLADAELITIKSQHGRPATIRPGKPVYQAAFVRLMEDPVVKARMDLAAFTELAKIEVKNIEKAEQELTVLAGLPNGPAQASGRVQYLLNKLEVSQKKIEAFEKEMGGLKTVLGKEE